MAAESTAGNNGHIGVRISFHDLQFFLSSTNDSVVETAYLRLRSNLPPDESNSNLLQNHLLFVRLDVLAYLRQINNPDSRAIDLVVPLLRDPDKRVRFAAGFTLAKLMDEPIAPDQPDKWEQWWAQNKPLYLLLESSRILKFRPRDGRGYHARGCVNYDLGFFTNALADFREGCRMGSDVTDYSQCRIWLIRSQLGEQIAATRDMEQYLAHRRPGDWSVKIGEFLVGQMSEAGLLQAATSPGTETTDGQRCEACFYIGSRNLIDGNQKAAIQNFRECIATGSSNFEEYASAEIELVRLSLATSNSNIFGTEDDRLRLLIDTGDGHGHGFGGGAGGYHGSEYRASFYMGRAWTFSGLAKTNRMDILFSKDKRKIVAMVLGGGPIYATANGGLHWAVFDSPGHYHFRLTGDETDGGFIAAATLLPHPQTDRADVAEINSSGQYGSTASAEMTPLKQDWYAVAVGPHGNKLILSSLSTPTLTITKAGPLVIVSWPSSFSGFILQENTDISTPNWTDVTNNVVTVPGENQVAINPQEANNFFRLKSTR
jgi:hypothetical protein